MERAQNIPVNWRSLLDRWPDSKDCYLTILWMLWTKSYLIKQSDGSNIGGVINNERRCDGDGMICFDWQTMLGRAMGLLQQQIQSHKLNKTKGWVLDRGCCSRNWFPGGSGQGRWNGLIADSLFGGLTSGVERFLNLSKSGPSNQFCEVWAFQIQFVVAVGCFCFIICLYLTKVFI